MKPGRKKFLRDYQMKKDLRGFILAGFIFSFYISAHQISFAAGGEKEISYNPVIESVLVYPDRALVIKSQKLSFEPGKYKLIFQKANPNLVSESLRAFSDNKGTIIQGISSYLERQTETINPQIRKMEKELQGLESKKEEFELIKKRFNQDLENLQEYQKYLSKVISALSAFRAPGQSGPEKWHEANEFIFGRWLMTKESLQKNDAQLAELQERVGMLKASIQQKIAGQSKSSRVVEITLQANEKCDASISFSYIIYQAFWTVSYGMYLQRDNKILIEYYGEIKQKTGEDWKNITLKLSTSTPAHGAQRPEINPLGIYAQKLKTKTVYTQEEKKVADEMVTGADRIGGLTEGGKPDMEKFTVLEDSGSSQVFKIRLPANIPSSDEVHRVTIDKFYSKKAKLGYRIVPYKRKIAHLEASFVHDQPFPLLTGKVDIYRISGFMGRSSIPFTPPGAELVVGFGAERSIKLKREVYHYRKTTGVISREKVFETELVTEIENHGSQIKNISFYERVPVSQVEEIQIQILPKTSPGFEIKPKDSGILKWILALPPGSKQKIILNFEVKTPGNFPGEILGR
jgi:uncharacterized protein (TIGR02231 family)